MVTYSCRRWNDVSSTPMRFTRMRLLRARPRSTLTRVCLDGQRLPDSLRHPLRNTRLVSPLTGATVRR